MNANQLNAVGTNPNEFGSEVIIYKSEYDEIIANCKNSSDFILELLKDEISKDDKLREYSDKFDFSRMFNNSTVGVSAHITIDIIDFKEDVLPPLTLNYFGTFFMQSFNEKHMNELSDKIGRKFTLRMHRNMFKDNITIALVSYNPYLVRQGATKDNSFNAYEYLKKARGEETLKYEDFNDIKDIGIEDASVDQPKGKFVISEKEFDNYIEKIRPSLTKDAEEIFNKVKANHKEFFDKHPKTWTYILENEDDFGEGVYLYKYDMHYINAPEGIGKSRIIESKYPELGQEFHAIGRELIDQIRGRIIKYFKEWEIKGLVMKTGFLGDWDDGPVGIHFNNIYFTSEGTEALKDIVKKVAKKAADKAGLIPAGTIDINKTNIKGFAKACDILQNYGQSRELINRSFRGININTFGSKANLDAFMNSIKPVGKFRVAQGWLVFDLFETDTYKLKNYLDKEPWNAMYNAAGMVTKKANYVTIKIIKELFGSRGIELHPNPIGHLLSKGSTKASIMFKLGKIRNVEDGTYSAGELVDNLRAGIGVESFEFKSNVFDVAELEYGIEEVVNDYNFFETIGIESDMISIAEAFGEIEDLDEMIAIESYGIESSIAKTDYMDAIISEIHNRMESDPVLKLAKDKELIEVKANPNSKRRISINFKEIKEIEKVLTPEDIQKYGGSTYQFLLKLSDTFNKNIMWKMKEIEETARSGGSGDPLDTEAVESLRGREYYLAVGIETVDDILNEILAEDGTEGFDEFKESAKAWIKKMIAKIIDFLGKERWIYRAQVKTYSKIKAKIDSIGKDNYQNYDLYNIKGAISTLAFINKKKYLFYRGLSTLNFENIENIKGSMKYLDSAKEDLRTAIDKLQKVASKIKSGNYSYRDPQMGDLNTIKSTMSKVKLEWVDVKQNFLKLEKMINDEKIEDETIKNGLKGFLTVSTALQREYLKGVNEALSICSELLKENKLSNESIEVEIFCGTESVFDSGLEAMSGKTAGLLAGAVVAGTFLAIPLVLKSAWDHTPWGKKQVQKKVEEQAKRQEDEKRRVQAEIESKETEAVYKQIAAKAIPTIEKISQSVLKKMKNMPEFKTFVDEVENSKDELAQEWKGEMLYFNADEVEDYGDAICAFGYTQGVWMMDSWKELEKALLNEMNSKARSIPCKDGYEWIFVGPCDDESCFWCVLQYTGNGGGNESVEDEVYYDVIAFEDADDYYNDPAHYKGSFSDAIKILKNGIVAFLKPLTPSGRREALKKKQEEQEKLEREREEAAKKNEQDEKDYAEMGKLYDQYIKKALPVAKKEAEKIVKMIPNFPNFKALVKEVSDYGKENDWKSATDCIFYYVSGRTDLQDYETLIIGYDQDLMGFDNHDRIEEMIISKLDRIADKIPHPEGWRWNFNGPYDDEACVWMNLVRANQVGTEGFFSNLKEKWKNKTEQMKRDVENQKRLNKALTLTEDQAKKLRDNAFKVAKEMFKDLNQEAKKAGLNIELSQSNEFHNVIMITSDDRDEYSWDINLATYYDKDSYDDAVRKYEEFPKIISDVVDKHKSKLGYEIDGWETNNDENIIIPMPKAIKISNVGNESKEIGEEGIFDSIKQKWKDGVEKQKARRVKEREERTKQQFGAIKDKAIKVFSSKAEFDKFVANSEKVVKLIYDEIKKNVSSSELNYIQISPFDDLDGAATVNSDYDPELQLEFHFVHYSTPKWTQETHEDVFEQEEKLQDIIKNAIDKYKSKFGVPIEYYGIDGNLSWGTTDGYVVIDENKEPSNESKLIQAVYDEFGIEGITNIIQKITSKR